MSDYTNLTPAELASEIAFHTAHIKPHADAIDELKEEIRARYGHKPDTYPAGNLSIQVQPNNQLDTKKFMEAYPPDAFPSLYKQVPNSDAIAPNLKAQFYKPAKPKVVIK